LQQQHDLEPSQREALVEEMMLPLGMNRRSV